MISKYFELNVRKFGTHSNLLLFQDDASSSGTDMSICRSEALFSSYKDAPGTSESLIQVSSQII